VHVVPIRLKSRLSDPRSLIVALAVSSERLSASTTSKSRSLKNVWQTVSAAILLANSPTACPPIPSATISKWPCSRHVLGSEQSRIAQESWLLRLRKPISLTDA